MMMYSRTRFIYALLLAASFFVEGGAQTNGTDEDVALTALSTSSTSSSATSPSATPTSPIAFIDTPQPTTCSSSTIAWKYNGTVNSLITIAVTNIGVPQVDPPSLSTSSPSISTSAVETSFVGRRSVLSINNSSQVNMTIATNLTTESFIWNPVNVPPGWYIFVMTIPDQQLMQSSLPFLVRTGTNTSCLDTNHSTTATSSTPSSSHHTATSITVSQSSPSKPLISDISSSPPSIKVGVVVGASIGMAALLIGVVALGLFLYRKGKRRSHTNDGSSSNLIHRWDDLNSTDSQRGFLAKPSSGRNPSHSQANSDPNSFATSMGLDFEDATIITGPEKTTSHINFVRKASKDPNFFEDHDVALSNLPVLHHQAQQRQRPDRTYSTSSSTSNVFNMNDIPVQRSSVLGSTPHKKFSIDSSSAHHHPSPLPVVLPPALRESAHYVVTPDMFHSYSQSSLGGHNSSSHSHQTSTNLHQSLISSSPPISPSGTTALQEIKQMNRQSLGRKRKPVPVYDPNEDPTSPRVQPPPSPFSVSTNDNNRDSVVVPELTHKSSFGPGGVEGRPLHYLVPDMPVGG